MTEVATPLLVVDDHAVMAESIAVALRLHGFSSVTVVSGEGIEVDAVLAAAGRSGPETVVVLDLHLGDGRLSTAMIPVLRPNVARVLVLTAERDPRRLGECLEAGADGVFDKAQTFDDLMDLLRDAVAGYSVMSLGAREELLVLLRDRRRDEAKRERRFSDLTPREREVLAGLVAGESAEEMARSSSVAISTVRTHVKSVLRKLGVNSQLAAVALAREWGWDDLAE